MIRRDLRVSVVRLDGQIPSVVHFEFESPAGYHVKCSPVEIVSLAVRVATVTATVEPQDML